MNARETRDDPAGWMVLRCGGQETQALEAFLIERGLTAWTPQAWVRKRLPRKKGRVLTLIPVLPSYVFVRETGELTGHRVAFPKGFSVMVIRGEVVTIPDPALDPLRKADNRNNPFKRRKASLEAVVPPPPPVSAVLAKGDRVLLEGGPLGSLGLWGSVVDIRVGEALVYVEGSELQIWVSDPHLKRLRDP